MSACMGVGECVHPRVHVGACGRMFFVNLCVKICPCVFVVVPGLVRVN